MGTLIGTFVGIIVAAGLFLGLVYATRRSSRTPQSPVGDRVFSEGVRPGPGGTDRAEGRDDGIPDLQRVVRA